MLKDNISVKGDLDIVVYDTAGQPKDKRKINNLVVAVGKNYIASRMVSNATVVMNHLAVGSSNVTPSLSQTILGAELDRVPLDSSSLNNNVISYSATFGSGQAVGTISEAGIFNNASANAGIMLCRTRFNEITKGNADTIVITWNLTIE